MWVLEGGAERVSLGGFDTLNLLRLESSYEDQAISGIGYCK